MLVLSVVCLERRPTLPSAPLSPTNNTRSTSGPWQRPASLRIGRPPPWPPFQGLCWAWQSAHLPVPSCPGPAPAV